MASSIPSATASPTLPTTLVNRPPHRHPHPHSNLLVWCVSPIWPIYFYLWPFKRILFCRWKWMDWMPYQQQQHISAESHSSIPHTQLPVNSNAEIVNWLCVLDVLEGNKVPGIGATHIRSVFGVWWCDRVLCTQQMYFRAPLFYPCSFYFLFLLIFFFFRFLLFISIGSLFVVFDTIIYFVLACGRSKRETTTFTVLAI